MSGHPSESEYGLVMPFVVCEDQGGPYHAESFVAGWALSQLDTKLSSNNKAFSPAATVEEVVRTASLPQADLIAMRYGYTMTSTPWKEHPDEWSFATFTRGAADARPVEHDR